MHSFRIICSFLMLLAALSVSGQIIPPSLNPNDGRDTSLKSIRALATGSVGNAKLQILYHSPRVRNRMIWGGLVPYGEVWVTGAHMATRLETNQHLQIGATTLAPGKYALFTIPGENDWTFIVNKNHEQHLADDYDSKDDLLRITIPALKQEKTLERLQYFIEATGENKGIIAIQWEKVRIEVPFSIVSENKR